MKVQLDTTIFPFPLTIYNTDEPDAGKVIESIFQPTIYAESGGKMIYTTGQTKHRWLFWGIVMLAAFFVIQKLKG